MLDPFLDNLCIRGISKIFSSDIIDFVNDRLLGIIDGLLGLAETYDKLSKLLMVLQYRTIGKIMNNIACDIECVADKA